jgi:hypothetical protein
MERTAEAHQGHFRATFHHLWSLDTRAFDVALSEADVHLTR